MFWWPALAESGEAGRSGLCVLWISEPWLHQLGLGSCRQELTLILPRTVQGEI